MRMQHGTSPNLVAYRHGLDRCVAWSAIEALA